MKPVVVSGDRPATFYFGIPEAAVAAAAKAYRVYFAKSKTEAESGEYLMDHTSIIYLMGPDGRYLTHFSHGVTAETMAKRIREILN